MKSASPKKIPLEISLLSEFTEKGEIKPILVLHEIGCPAWNQGSWRASVAARRSDASRTGEIRDIRRAMIVFPTEGNVLAGHVIESCGRIPRLIGIARILREVGGSGTCGRAIDGRQQNQVAAGVVDLPAAESQAVAVFLEPETVVEHDSEEVLLRALGRISSATYAASMFTAEIASQRERGLVQHAFRMVVILDFNAVVGVVTHAARIV